MMKLVAVAMCGALLGCANNPLPPLRRQEIAWDGLGTPPGKHIARKRSTSPTQASSVTDLQKHLESLAPYSKEWWTAYRELDDAEHHRLDEVMAICSGCTLKTSSDALAVLR